MTDIQVRPTVADDLLSVGAVADAAGLFPSDMLPDMIAPYLSATAADLWLSAVVGDAVVGFLFCEPERATDRAFNMLALGVLPGDQGRGVGTALTRALERVLADRGERLLIVETSSLPEFEQARGFYRARGYEEEARVRDFYADGEDKIVFRKRLVRS